MEDPSPEDLFSALDFWSTWMLSRRDVSLLVPKGIVLRTACMLAEIGATREGECLQGLVDSSENDTDRVRLNTFGPENHLVLAFFLARQEELPISGRDILVQVSEAFRMFHA